MFVYGTFNSHYATHTHATLFVYNVSKKKVLFFFLLFDAHSVAQYSPEKMVGGKKKNQNVMIIFQKVTMRKKAKK